MKDNTYSLRKLLKENKSPYDILEKYIPMKPNNFHWFIGRILVSLITLSHPSKFIYEFNKKDYKKNQVIIIADHASRDNFYYIMKGLKGFKPNIVMGYQNFYKKGLFKFFLRIGTIPKYLYAPDLKASKNIIRLLKENQSILFFPEGIQSNIGTTQPMNPASLKLLKHTLMIKQS